MIIIEVMIIQEPQASLLRNRIVTALSERTNFIPHNAVDGAFQRF